MIQINDGLAHCLTFLREGLWPNLWGEDLMKKIYHIWLKLDRAPASFAHVSSKCQKIVETLSPSRHPLYALHSEQAMATMQDPGCFCKKRQMHAPLFVFALTTPRIKLRPLYPVVFILCAIFVCCSACFWFHLFLLIRCHLFM
jgi:hypothetical protein